MKIDENLYINENLYNEYLKQINDDEKTFKGFLDFLIKINTYNITNDNGVYIVNELISISNIESMKLNLDNMIFNKDISFYNIKKMSITFEGQIKLKKLEIINNIKKGIIESIKTSLIKNIECESLSIIGCDIKLTQLYGEIIGYFRFTDCKFEKFYTVNLHPNAILDIYFCCFTGVTSFAGLKFNKKVNITNTIFKEDVSFYDTIFYDSVNFENSKFEKYANFYGVTFHKQFNFSQTVFKNGINLTNTNTNFSFKALKESVILQLNEDKYNDEHMIRYGKIKSLNKIANDYRDSFRNIKNGLLKDNNNLDASQYNKLEFYAKEIELEHKETSQKSNEQTEKSIITKTKDFLKNIKIKFFTRDSIDKYVLLAYRTTSDHHTDLIKIFNFLIINIGIFGFLSTGVVFVSNYIDGYWSLLPSDSIKFYNAHFAVFDSGTWFINMILFFLFIAIFMFSILNKYIYWICLAIGYFFTAVFLTISPKYLIPAIGIFTDKRELFDPLATIGAAYSILFAFLFYSFIKTARKNTIVLS